MSQSHRPLTPKERALVEAYRGKGTGVHAAREAGYEGTDASLRTIASKTIRHPEARAILEARKTERDAREADEIAARAVAKLPSDGTAPSGVGVDPLAVYAEVALDTDAIPAARVAAAYRIERALADANTASSDPHAALRAEVNASVKAMRERERETGCCARCHQPLPERR